MIEIVGTRRINKLRVLIAVLLAVVLGFGLTACSSTSSRDSLSSFWGDRSSSDSSSDEESEFEGRGYEETVDRYVELIFEPDLNQIYEELCHKNLIDRLKEESGEEYDELLSAEQNVLEYYQEQNEDYYGVGWTISTEIVSDRTVDGSEEIVDIYDSVGVEIAEFKEIQMVRTFSSADGTLRDRDFATVYTARVGNTWYMEPLSMSGNY